MVEPTHPDGRSNRERMLAGDPYLADDPELWALRRRAADLLTEYNATTFVQRLERDRILRELVADCGPDVEIVPPFHCDYGTQLHLGARTYANVGLVALDVVDIAIGDDVLIGPNVQLITATHPLDPAERRTGRESGAPITVGDNAWLGAGVVVLPGVSVGSNTVVGAGAVVTKDLPSGVVAAGNPARVLRRVAD